MRLIGCSAIVARPGKTIRRWSVTACVYITAKHLVTANYQDDIHLLFIEGFLL